MKVLYFLGPSKSANFVSAKNYANAAMDMIRISIDESEWIYLNIYHLHKAIKNKPETFLE